MVFQEVTWLPQYLKMWTKPDKDISRSSSVDKRGEFSIKDVISFSSFAQEIFFLCCSSLSDETAKIATSDFKYDLSADFSAASAYQSLKLTLFK